MKTSSIQNSILGLLVIGMIGCVPTQTTAQQPATPDPIAVAQQYIQVLNTGNLDRALAFYADDAIVHTPVGLFIGKAQIARWLASENQSTRVSPRDWKMQGALVVSTGTVLLERFVKAGVGAVEFRSEYLVDKSGKIRFFGPVLTLTPEQQQKMREAQAGAPPAPAPSVNPIEVVKAYHETANTGDFEKTFAFFADDSGAFVMNGTLLLSGKKQIADLWLREDVKTTRVMPREYQANGNLVISMGMVSLERFRRIGVDPIAYRAQFVVENGKIRFFYPTLQFTPEQLEKIQAAQRTPANR
jgi:ketosteroid isomerase-like protein